jgi:hypothetical protein
VFKQSKLSVSSLSDASGTSENRFYAKPTVTFDVMESAVKQILLLIMWAEVSRIIILKQIRSV